MKKLLKHRRYVLAAGLLAVSAFAMAPGIFFGNANIAALLDRMRPQLQDPNPHLHAPRFNVLAPQPDYSLPAVAHDESGDVDGEEPLLVDVGSDALAGSPAGGIDGVGGGDNGGGTGSLLAYGRGAGSGGAIGSSGGGSGGRDSVQPSQTSAPRTDDGAGSSAPTDIDQGSGSLVPVNPPAPDDLHNPVEQPGGNGKPGDGNGKPGDGNGKPGNVATVPEPSALSLLAVGIIGLVLCRRRSSR